MRKLIFLPVVILALALPASGAMAQMGGASGTSGGAAAKSSSDATAPKASGATDGIAKPMTKTKKKKKM
jgi:hypothetical protein